MFFHFVDLPVSLFTPSGELCGVRDGEGITPVTVVKPQVIRSKKDVYSFLCTYLMRIHKNVHLISNTKKETSYRGTVICILTIVFSQ